mmetsp:Transcript_4855/g.14387  ORF Transcript_4855/g.14387 Transcript_4855/m.14387 type:complete len:337 (-) Transcript_4855:59-1069(-)
MDFLFSVTSSISAGDPYRDPPLDPYKHGHSKGKRQFLTAPPKKGQTANAIGYGPLAYKAAHPPGKEPYLENYKLQAKRRMASKSRFLTSNGFMYSSPMKKSSVLRCVRSFKPSFISAQAPGDYEGTFRCETTGLRQTGGLAEREGLRRAKIKIDTLARRNIMTCPGPRGGFGVAGTLIGGSDIEYVSSEYGAAEDARRADARKHRAIIGERRPFTSTTRCREVFGLAPRADIVPPRRAALAKAPRPRTAGYVATSFRPTSPARVGYNATFSAFPRSEPEPFDDRAVRRAQLPQRRMPVAVSSLHLSAVMRERKPFRPTSTSKTGIVRPICTVGARP